MWSLWTQFLIVVQSLGHVIKIGYEGGWITQINVTPFTKFGVLGQNWWKCFMQHHPKLIMNSSWSLEVSKTKTLITLVFITTWKNSMTRIIIHLFTFGTMMIAKWGSHYVYNIILKSQEWLLILNVNGVGCEPYWPSHGR
jgi:hypothetical protein